MFEPKSPEEIRKIAYAVIDRLAKNAKYDPKLFYPAMEGIIEDAIRWQKKNPTKSAWGNYRIDMRIRNHMQIAIRNQRKADMTAK